MASTHPLRTPCYRCRHRGWWASHGQSDARTSSCVQCLRDESGILDGGGHRTVRLRLAIRSWCSSHRAAGRCLPATRPSSPRSRSSSLSTTRIATSRPSWRTARSELSTGLAQILIGSDGSTDRTNAIIGEIRRAFRGHSRLPGAPGRQASDARIRWCVSRQGNCWCLRTRGSGLTRRPCRTGEALP